MKHVLVDTSVWVSHFRHTNDALVRLLTLDLVLIHPLVVGEIACGTPPYRERTLADLERLQACRQATISEALLFIEREQLSGLGCGVVDMLLLASTLMTPDAELWTLDKHLGALAGRYGVCHSPVAY